ncbi:MAG: adenosylmethionine decarboxylase [Defluviitaleaceae bacterium]|nr:adenosylmethionine decarboxylase [Defluviitaleaceae bacterium]
MKPDIYGDLAAMLQELEICRAEEISPALVLLGEGGLADSLAAARLVTDVEQKFGVDIIENDLDLDCLRTVGALAEYIAANSPLMKSDLPEPEPIKITVGKHLILDCSACPAKVIESLPFIKNLLRALAAAASVTIVEEIYHEYTPYGITGLAIVSESHISIHTWPEYDYLGIDIFSCKEIDAGKVEDALKAEIPGIRIKSRYIERTAGLGC